MRQLGSLMLFFGVFAIGLDFVGRVPSFLIWIYNWGTGPAWGIKIALVVVGAALWFFGGSNESEES